MSYIGAFLGRLPAAPARMEPRQVMPQGQVGLHSRLPRPPGHPSSLAAVQPGPKGTQEPIDANMLVPAVSHLLADEQPKPQPQPKPGPPYVPLPAPPNGEGSPGWLPKPPPPTGGVVGPTPPGGQPNPGDGYGGLYPPGTIGNSQPLTPLQQFLLRTVAHAV